MLFTLGIYMLAKGLHRILQRSMEMLGVFLKDIIRCKICTTAKPAINTFVVFVVQLKIPPVGMYCRHKRIERMYHQRQPCCKEITFRYVERLLHSCG